MKEAASKIFGVKKEVFKNQGSDLTEESKKSEKIARRGHL